MRPVRSFSSVDFPAPLRPMSPMRSPGSQREVELSQRPELAVAAGPRQADRVEDDPAPRPGRPCTSSRRRRGGPPSSDIVDVRRFAHAKKRDPSRNRPSESATRPSIWSRPGHLAEHHDLLVGEDEEREGVEVEEQAHVVRDHLRRVGDRRGDEQHDRIAVSRCSRSRNTTVTSDRIHARPISPMTCRSRDDGQEHEGRLEVAGHEDADEHDEHADEQRRRGQHGSHGREVDREDRVADAPALFATTEATPATSASAVMRYGTSPAKM